MLEQPTLPSAAHDRAGNGGVSSGNNQGVAQPLVRSLEMIMLHEISACRRQVVFSQDDQAAQALLFEGAYEPLGVGIQIWLRGGSFTAFTSEAASIPRNAAQKRGSRSWIKYSVSQRKPSSTAVRFRAIWRIHAS